MVLLDNPCVSRQSILHSLLQWDNVQHLANILQHPSLIEEERRFGFLMKGLQDSDKYLVLSAIVGIQGLKLVRWKLVANALRFSPEETTQIKSVLFELVSNNVGVVASRAFTSLELLLSSDDMIQVLEFL